jgi:hypothetical protein
LKKKIITGALVAGLFISPIAATSSHASEATASDTAAVSYDIYFSPPVAPSVPIPSPTDNAGAWGTFLHDTRIGFEIAGDIKLAFDVVVKIGEIIK